MTITCDWSERSTGNDFPREGNRQRLIRAIAELAGERPSPDHIDALALRLSTKYPQSGLTIDEICRRIGQALSGNGPRDTPGR